MKNNIKFPTNSFYLKAHEYRQYATEDAEIEKIDMTEDFWLEIEETIKQGELINIQVNGRVRTGKSTQAIRIGQRIFKLLQKHGKRPKTDKFTINNIARDEQEYSELMRDENIRQTVIVTDESNELEKGGENSSVETALRKVYSDVHAGRYVHRVSCAPKEVIDNNADIVLEIITVNKKERMSYNRLYYRVSDATVDYFQLIGHVKIKVSDVIEKWESEGKHIYDKFERRTKKEEKRLEELKKEDVYIEYMLKKYEKMELITKEGIFRPRMLGYASMVFAVKEELKGLAKMGGSSNKNIVRNFIKMEAKKKKIPLSIVGEELITREVLGILDLYIDYNKQLIKQQKERQQWEKGNTETEIENANKEVILTANQANKTIQEIIQELKQNTKKGQKIDYTGPNTTISKLKQLKWLNINSPQNGNIEKIRLTTIFRKG